MSIIVDASVAVKLIVKEDGHENALRLVAGQTVIAPDFVLVETANVLWRKVRLSQLSRQQALDGISFIREAYTVLVPATVLLDAAFDLSLELDHPVYDCLYVACAEQEKAELITVDRRLAQKVAGRNGLKLTLLSGIAP